MLVYNELEKIFFSGVLSLFMILEGIDGCGKSTLARRIADAVRAAGREAAVAFEPGDWEGGGELRRIILEADLISPTARFLLFLADRAEHVARKIRPALDAGRVVICDRYSPSTVAYQIDGAGLDADTGQMMRRALDALAFPTPDIALWLDCSLETARARAEARGRLSMFERMGGEFYSRVRAGYEAMATADPAHWIRIDADMGPDEVYEAAAREIKSRYPEMI